MKNFPKLLTAAAAAVLISVGSVSAQAPQTGNPKASRDFFQSQMTPEAQIQMSETFRGMGNPNASIDATFDPTPGTVLPEGLQTQPVPTEIFTAMPETEGYHYVTLADGRTALVHPVDRDIVVVFD